MPIDWEKLYYKLIDSRKILSHVSENHHIIPTFTGGTDEPSNLVPLLHYDHILAHYIRYRWKGEYGDSCAYKMMNGNIINPMYDPNVLSHHIKVMNNPSMVAHLSNKAIQRFNDPNERQKVSNHRKKYISTLDDPAYAARFMHTDESRRKSRLGLIEYNKNNPELIKARQLKSAKTNKEQNKLLSIEELKIKYARGSSIDNPNWKGYCYLIKDNIMHKFNTRTEFGKVCELDMGTILIYINNGKPFKKGKWKDFKIVISKEEL